MNIPISKDWKTILKDYIKKSKFTELISFIEDEYRSKTIYPKRNKIFNAFNITPFKELSVVIIGQDPYHNPEQAHGLSFSVPEGVRSPPSLRNIYKEVQSDLSIEKDFSMGNLEYLSKQGVFLLNSVLTVEENKPGSHAKIGWEDFTDHVIQKISTEKEHCVFILWGNYAKQKGKIINREKHLVLESAHPSPLSSYKGFFGGKHFSKTNNYLKKYGKNKIYW